VVLAHRAAEDGVLVEQRGGAAGVAGKKGLCEISSVHIGSASFIEAPPYRFEIRSASHKTPKPGSPARGTRTGRPINVAFDLLGRRWALRVLWELREERLGFRALQERCEGMSSSVLRDRLRELVEARILDTDGDGRYGLTSDGKKLLRALEPLSRWAQRWGERAQSPPPRR
jgi:DNA-binding HxlR family transcriptional regulator